MIWPGYDWGQRTPRWVGTTRHVVEVGGTRAHYLRAGADGPDPTHLPWESPATYVEQAG